MSKMNATDKKAMELLERLNDLVEASIDLDEDFDTSDDMENVLIFLDDVIDEFCEAVELVEDIRTFLLELDALDKEETPEVVKNDIPADLKRIAESMMNYERMAREKRRCSACINSMNRSLAGCPAAQPPEEPAVQLPEEDSVALIFYDDETYRVFPFEHAIRICPWLNERSVMKAVPGMEDIYYLYEEGAEVKTQKGTFLVSPIVVIRLNADHFVVTPGPLDRHRIRKFITDSTETVEFEEGASYQALRIA